MQPWIKHASVAGCLALAVALGGCGAVEAWRSVAGIAKNDPDPESALFSGNLAASEAAPYPNLASVPPPPSRATTTAERRKLTESLVADRAGTEAVGAPFAPAAAASAKPARAATARPSDAAASLAPIPSGAAAASSPAVAPAPGRIAANASQSAHRRSGELAEPAARESSLQMRAVR